MQQFPISFADADRPSGPTELLHLRFFLSLHFPSFVASGVVPTFPGDSEVLRGSLHRVYLKVIFRVPN
jgi:hypothetical protein